MDDDYEGPNFRGEIFALLGGDRYTEDDLPDVRGGEGGGGGHEQQHGGVQQGDDRQHGLAQHRPVQLRRGGVTQCRG